MELDNTFAVDPFEQSCVAQCTGIAIWRSRLRGALNRIGDNSLLSLLAADRRNACSWQTLPHLNLSPTPTKIGLKISYVHQEELELSNELAELI